VKFGGCPTVSHSVCGCTAGWDVSSYWQNQEMASVAVCLHPGTCSVFKRSHSGQATLTLANSEAARDKHANTSSQEVEPQSWNRPVQQRFRAIPYGLWYGEPAKSQGLQHRDTQFLNVQYPSVLDELSRGVFAGHMVSFRELTWASTSQVFHGAFRVYLLHQNEGLRRI
jgi:hypothetical protein